VRNDEKFNMHVLVVVQVGGAGSVVGAVVNLQHRGLHAVAVGAGTKTPPVLVPTKVRQRRRREPGRKRNFPAREWNGPR